MYNKKFCMIDGCSGNYVAKGYCQKHYRRWKRHGDPLTMANCKRERADVRVKRTTLQTIQRLAVRNIICKLDIEIADVADSSNGLKEYIITRWLRGARKLSVTDTADLMEAVNGVMNSILVDRVDFSEILQALTNHVSREFDLVPYLPKNDLLHLWMKGTAGRIFKHAKDDEDLLRCLEAAYNGTAPEIKAEITVVKKSPTTDGVFSGLSHKDPSDLYTLELVDDNDPWGFGKT